MHQRQPQRVERAQRTPRLLARGTILLIGNAREQAVKLHRVDAQPRGEAAEDPVPVVGLEIFGQREARILERGLGAAIGAACPIGRIEQLSISRDGLDAGERVRGAEHPEERAPARRRRNQRRQFLEIVARRRARAGDDVDRIAELLEHGIMWDRPDLTQIHLAVGGEIGLAARFAAAGLVQQPKPESGDRAGIGARSEMIALHAPDAAIIIEAEIGAVVKGIAVGR